MKKLFTLLLFVSTVCTIFGQWTRLNDSLLEGGYVNDFASYGSNLFMASEGGIYKSTDNGATWTYSMNGISYHNTYINSLATTSSGIYAVSDKLYFSTDGNSWTALTTTGIPANAYIQDIDEIADTLYSIVVDQSNNVFIYTSTDGTNWTQGASLGNSFNNINLLDFNSSLQFIELDTLLLYTADGSNIDTVDFSSIQITPYDFDYNMTGEPNGDYLYYLDDNNNIIYQYTISTKTWTDVTNNLPGGSSALMGVCGTDNAIFVAVISIIPSISVDMYQSTDHGATWTMIPGTGLETLKWFDKLYQIAPNEYIGQSPRGNIYYSNDNGATWTLSQTAYYGRDMKDLIESNGRLISYLELFGVIISDDNGNTWSFSNNGLTPFFADLYFVEGLFEFGSTKYISYVNDPMTENADLYYSTDNGDTWQANTTLPDSLHIAFAGKNGNGFILKLWSSDENNYSYQLTNDNGNTWTDITAAVNSINFEKNYGFTGYGSEWIIFGTDISSNPRAYITTNNFAVITDISNGLSGEFESSNDYWENKHLMAIHDYTGSGNIILVMRRWDLYPYVQQFYKFDGMQWNMITNSGLDADVYSATSIYNNNGTWYFAAKEGVFTSIDSCVTWTQTETNHDYLPLGFFPGKIVCTNNYIFLGTRANSIWRTDLPVNAEELVTDKQVIFYPNPAYDVIYLNVENADIRISDISGKSVIEKQNVSGQISVEQLSEGIYFIEINTNNKVEKRKFIKL
ncbi:MAG: hypothetical protein Kow0068_06300 [Marinilabiliales bacterium]